ncbi:unnamed protein product [Danaus chrysippus]|uniref:receptor protein serine/threonine kinase n=1 Tax=Danaus chrysippus TaxID=151541 RepID=A0A8J2R035_9NEOP|nr:unnamed protein product [Danaus chrysippus]
MMDGMLSQRVTPLLKCVVLFMFIFTAKVLTSRPHDSQDGTNSIHQQKSSHYVRTFTKYHHRRTSQWNNLEDPYWILAQDQPKVIVKRSVKQVGNELLNTSDDINQVASVSGDEVIDQMDKPAVTNDQRNTDSGKYKVKAAVIVTDAPTTPGPTISCLYKIHSVALSVTPSYHDGNAQFTVENEIFDRGEITETRLPSGEDVQVEKCTDPKAFCYTLWHQDNDANITVLGQGCWRSSQGGRACDKCTRVTARLPRTRFCCCTRSLCNADITTLKEESVTIKAESTMKSTRGANYSSVLAAGILALVAGMLMTVVFRKMYCSRTGLRKTDMSDGRDLEKGEVMGSGPDGLATGLLCVDNITLIEHIGQGKFGSVWRGVLGARPVAVKLYCSPAAWRKEAAIYAMPHLAHPNILRYYGSDSRSSLVEAGGRSQLVVLELCSESLRDRLVRAPLDWTEFATLAHGLASALAHLHTTTSSKPCIVHRDVNSGNVLVSVDGRARLADLGLAQALPVTPDRTCRLTEAGTLRYLSPEALEGALDLSGARAALCAVDVFALGLVLWEMLWRCEGAQTHVPPYAPPYHHHGLPARPTLAQMQALVSRGKARPPLPPPSSCGARALLRPLRLASATCDECWDHDAEARLTAVCVEERMLELKSILNSLTDLDRPPATQHGEHGSTDASLTDADKKCNANVVPTADSTPLLYPDPHMGRNTCIERNTNTHTQTHTVELIHKTHRDEHRNEQNGVTLAGTHAHRDNVERMNEIRSYQRPLEYVQNDVTSHEGVRDAGREKRWGLRRLFDKKNKDTRVQHTENNGRNGKVKTSLVEKFTNLTFDRPSNLILDDERSLTFEPCTLSPPNKTLSPTMMRESEMNTDKVFRELPAGGGGRVFAVIVPKVIHEPGGRSDLELDGEDELRSDGCSEDEQLLLAESGGGRVSMRSVLREAAHTHDHNNTHNKYRALQDEHSDHHDKENHSTTSSIKRQRSLEQVRDVFRSGDASLLNPAGRVKTPGDLPAAVRRARARERAGEQARNRLSLYDDRMMFGNTL